MAAHDSVKTQITRVMPLPQFLPALINNKCQNLLYTIEII